MSENGYVEIDGAVFPKLVSHDKVVNNLARNVNPFVQDDGSMDVFLDDSTLFFDGDVDFSRCASLAPRLGDIANRNRVHVGKCGTDRS